MLASLPHRRAPYAPTVAIRDFLERIRNVAVPDRVDRKFLQKMNIANNNEWSLLSALKFLGILDERGTPTHAYRLLQSKDQFSETLQHLVKTAYASVFDMGGADMTPEDLENYFRVTSSPSQARNAARFFREVCKLANLSENFSSSGPVDSSPRSVSPEMRHGHSTTQLDLLSSRVRLLDKLPPPQPTWSANDFQAIYDRFLGMLRYLES